MYEIKCDDSGESPIWLAPWNGQLYYELYHDGTSICLRKVESDRPWHDWALGSNLTSIGFVRMEHV